MAVPPTHKGTPLYDFAWLHAEARQVAYGTLTAQLKVHAGLIVHVAVTAIVKSRSLQDTQQSEAEGLG